MAYSTPPASTAALVVVTEDMARRTAECAVVGHDEEAARIGYFLAWECKRCGRLDRTNIEMRGW